MLPLGALGRLVWSVTAMTSYVTSKPSAPGEATVGTPGRGLRLSVILPPVRANKPLDDSGS